MTSKPSTTFCLLHLTDLHMGAPNTRWLWPNASQRFIDDLGDLVKNDIQHPIDVVVFTGDLTFSGKKEQFGQFTKWMTEVLWPTLQKNGSDPMFLAVPGNHDLERPDPSLASHVISCLRNSSPDHVFWSEEDSQAKARASDSDV